jgi:MoaA/NifB/PqqE/SkfB family radical SAM enzyme
VIASRATAIPNISRELIGFARSRCTTYDRARLIWQGQTVSRLTQFLRTRRSAAPARQATPALSDETLPATSAARSSKTFCVLPWTHFYTRPDGSPMVCCMGPEIIKKDDGTAFNVRTDRLDDIWNSNAYKSVRQSLLNGEQIDHCHICYKNEELGRFSRRQYANEKYGKESNDPFFNRLADKTDPLTVKPPVDFDLRLGNICNLKCRMCWVGYSSQIERDPVHARWSGGNGIPTIGENVKDWPEAVDLVEQLKAFSVEANRISLIGGEPTINEAQIAFIKHFVDNGTANTIELFAISNLTNAKPDVFGLISRFKNPVIDISLEGIGRTYDYIRFPGRWSAIERNIKSVQARYPNISLRILPTLQAYNILEICDLFQWCRDNNIDCQTYNILYHPAHLSVLVMPQEARDLAADRLEDWVAKRKISPTFSEGIAGVATYLRDRSQKPLPEDIDKFQQFTNDLDVSRKQSICEALPEFFALWERRDQWDFAKTRFAVEAAR